MQDAHRFSTDLGIKTFIWFLVDSDENLEGVLSHLVWPGTRLFDICYILHLSTERMVPSEQDSDCCQEFLDQGRDLLGGGYSLTLWHSR